MSIERHHTYSAYALIEMMRADGEEPVPMTELEKDFQRTLAELKKRTNHHEKYAGLIEMLRKLGHWKA